MDGVAQEMRHAARRLVRAPAFSLAAVLTLALAIGANASIFAVVDSVVLNPLPYPHSNRLIEIDHGAHLLNAPSGFGITQGLYHLYTQRSRVLESIAVYRASDTTVTGRGEPERIRVARVTPSLAAVLRVAPATGRWFTAQEGTPGAPRVVVLSHALWLRRYGGDPGIVGQPVMLGGEAMHVVGVMPASFAFPDTRVEAWTSERLAPVQGFGFWNYSAVARLREGRGVDDAQRELTGLVADVRRAYPGDPVALGNAETRLIVSVRTLKEAVVGGIARALWMLLAAVGLVLLVACANVANLFLVRSDARQREVAVRRALGADRIGIARYFLAESTLLSIAGGAIGLALAWGAVRLLVAFGPANLPRVHEVRLAGAALAFMSVLSIAAALMFGAIPSWRGIHGSTSLSDSGRGNTASRTRHRARHVLMGAQVAVALMLLVAAALMMRSFQKLRATDPGFDAQSALTFAVGLPEREYPSRRAAVAAHQAILDRVAAPAVAEATAGRLPGVKSASASTCLPLAGGCSGNTLLVQGRPIPEGGTPQLALFRAVAGEYFETMGMRIVRGRGIDRSDIERSEPVVVVNQALIERFFPNEDPIGQHVASNRPPPRRGEPPTLSWLRIVGVVSNTPTRALGEAKVDPQLFMPMSIAGGPDIPTLVGPDVSVMSYVVRSATPADGLLRAIRREVDAIDRNLAIAQVRTLQETLDRASAQMAFTMILLVIAAGMTLVLGVIGIYGIMSYVVSLRTGEIGVRLALGAEPGGIAGMIVRQGALVALLGTAAGLAGAFAGGRLIESLLYGVSPRDPVVFAITTLTLVAIALLACFVPARRAARLSPLEALRTE